MISNYKVTGMTCGHCVSSVTEEVSGLEGVKDVQVTLDGGAMVVESDAPVEFDDVKAAVAEAGNYAVAQA